MKNALLFAIACLLFSCTPDATPTPPVTSGTYYFVHYWKSDTLKNGYVGNHPTDSIYSFKNGDTSGIYYHGVKLYIFSTKMDTTQGIDMYGYISPNPFDTAAAYSRCWIYPYRYYKSSESKIEYQKQILVISKRAPHFDTTGDNYYYGK